MTTKMNKACISLQNLSEKNYHRTIASDEDHKDLKYNLVLFIFNL